ncbi:MAG: hypothetical protein WBV94_28435 [Blastocatellia bacterium]
MTVHLTTEQIKHYAGHKLSRAEWVGVNEHLFACEDCYQHFLGIFETSRKFPIEIDLDELAGLKNWHLQGEELRAYVEGRMGELDLDYANLHLIDCGWCREEVIHYSEFTSRLGHYLSKRHAPIKQMEVRSKYFPKFAAFPFAWNPIRVAGATALMLLLISAILLWSLLGTKPRIEESSMPVRSQEGSSSLAQATNTSQPVQASRPDTKVNTEEANSRGSSTHTYSNGGKTGDVRQESEASLIAENLVMPSVIKVFDRSSIMLRGDDSKSESFSVTSPYSTVISSDRPTFRWTALSGASSYVVSVYDARLNLISTSEPVAETQWLMPSRLKRGTLYTWVVTALKDGNKIIAPTLPARAEFKIIEESEQAKLNSQTKHLNSAAARGVIYARAGLLDEAEQELRAHISRYPKDGSAKRALRTVKSWREH